MGQHKHNPVAIAAQRGELPPKPAKKSRRQMDMEFRMAVLEAMAKIKPGLAGIVDMVGGPYNGRR